jgi:hypothetical protein
MAVGVISKGTIMEFIGTLWGAILLAALAAWFWSFLSWAALDLHRGDFKGLDDEEAVMALVRERGILRGIYMFPYMGGKDRNTPEMQAKWKAGPVGMLHVWRADVSMGKNMLLTYLTYAGASFLMGYVGHAVLPAGTDFWRVFQVMGTIGVLTYSVSFIPNMIWFQGKPGAMAMCVFDGLVQGLATGAVFAGMWPKGG